MQGTNSIPAQVSWPRGPCDVTPGGQGAPGREERGQRRLSLAAGVPAAPLCTAHPRPLREVGLAVWELGAVARAGGWVGEGSSGWRGSISG